MGNMLSSLQRVFGYGSIDTPQSTITSEIKDVNVEAKNVKGPGKEVLFKNAYLVGQSGGPLDVLVKNGTVVEISTHGKRNVQYKGDIVDVRGEWLAPSMIDWHVHSKLAALHSHRVDLKDCHSADEVFSTMKAALSNPHYDRYELTAINMRNGDWSEEDNKRMCRLSLDQLVSSTRPMYLHLNGYHSLIANTIGLEHANVDPEKFPDGHLRELDAFPVTYMLSRIEDDLMDKWLDVWADTAASLGVTEVTDLELDFNVRDWHRRYLNGFNKLRVHCGIYEDQFEDILQRGLKSGDEVPGTDGLVKVGPYKIITDGGLGSQTAYCHDPYPGTNDHGILAYTPESLAHYTQKAIHHGFKLAIHAIGDEANTIVLQTLESNPSPPLPNSTIEHAQLLDFRDISAFRRLNLIASVQPRHLVDDRETCLRFWPGREGRAWALKALRDAGVPMKFGSDSPVADMSPWEAMAVAMSRRGKGGLTLSEEQAIDAETAWRSSTWSGESHVRIGDRADLIVIDRNPLACDAERVRSTVVRRTMLDGRWTYVEEAMI